MKTIARTFLFSVALVGSLAASHFAWAESVAGTVVGPDDKPVAATVYFLPSPFWAASHLPVKTSADGVFRLEVTPAQQTVSPDVSRGNIAVYAPGFSIGLGPLKMGQGNVFKLAPLRKATGVLRDERGAPVAGATVQVAFIFQDDASSPRARNRDIFFNPAGALQQSLTTKTDESGAWEIAGIPPAAGAVISLVDDNYVQTSIQIDRQGDVDGPGRDQKFVAVRAGSISGRVTDSAGKPVAGVPLVATSLPGGTASAMMVGQASTAADGNFRISRLAPGTYNLLVREVPAWRGRASLQAPPKPHPNFVALAVEKVEVTAAQDTKTAPIQVVPGATVSGRVLDRATGKPLANVAVGAFGKGAPRGAGLLATDMTDADGHYSFDVVPGANALYAFEEGRYGNDKPEVPTTVPVMLAAGQTKNVSLMIDRSFADLQGQVVDEAGKPVKAVEITLWNSAGTGNSLTSDDAGNFTVKDVRKGTLRLDPGPQWTLVQPKTLTVPLNNETPLKIVVRPNRMGQVVGHVVDVAGVPIAGVKLRFEVPFKLNGQDVRFIRNVTSDEKGNYTVDQVNMPDALKLTVSTVNKDGYQLRTKGGVSPDAKESVDTIQLGDMVMEQLGNALHGVVVNSVNQLVPGALVSSAGDNFQAVATTDKSGHFTLAGQPNEHFDLIGAQGRSFGRVSSTGDGTTITLQQSDAVPGRDIGQAMKLFQEMAPIADENTIGKAVTAMAPYAPVAALELSLKAPDAKPDSNRAWIIQKLTSKSSPVALDWAQNELSNIKGDAEFVTAVTSLGMALAEGKPEIAKALFEQAQQRSPANALTSTAHLAALAERLKLPAAPALFNQVLAGARQNGTDLFSVVEPLSAGSADLAGQILSVLPQNKEREIISYDQAIQQVARYDAPGAKGLLDEMRAQVDDMPDLPEDAQGHLQGKASMEFEWAFAAKAVLRAMEGSEVPDDVASAQSIARQVQKWHRVSALALAAEFGTKEQRLAMAQETMNAEDRGDWMKNITMPRMAALIAEIDEDGAKTLFADSANALVVQRREQPDTSSANWAFYAAFSNPAAARLALESDWARTQHAEVGAADAKFNPVGWKMANLAKAMSSVDFAQAVQWAHQVPDAKTGKFSGPRADVLEFLGEFLLQEPAKRRLLTVGVETGFDS